MIEINGLSKVFGTQRAVDDVSFRVEEGEIMGFLGPNGAGKSTTMNILTGYLSATSGTCRVNGIDILENPLEAKRNIGFLPEMPPLYTDMTVKEYLSFIYDLKGCTFPRNQHLREICDVVKIGDVYDRLIGNLSKGYRQRVGIAGAIVGNPEGIIFDEPTNGLDPNQILEIRNLIRELGKERTIILSTHILSEVKAVCDRILIINEGKIVADEKTENIENALRGNRRLVYRIDGPNASVLSALKKINGVVYAEIAQKYEDGSATYILESKNGIDVRKPIFYALAQNSWPILSLEIKGSDLEDIFISVVDEAEAETASQKQA